MSAPLIIGQYALFDQVACGGMATVHIGALLGSGGFTRTVAIKRLHPPYARDADFVTEFLYEARIASRIRHLNVVTTLDVVAIQGELFLVMEYEQGASLAHLLKLLGPSGRIPLPILVSIVTGALNGLHAAHNAISETGESLEVVHRDVSPQNLLVGIDGVTRVLDFGVAKVANKTHQTRDGQVKGKLAYMAPEQLRGQKIDRRADVYGIGAVLWEALTGRCPFSAENDWLLMHRICETQLEKPSSVNQTISSALDDLLMATLSKRADDRPASAQDLATALEQIVQPASSRSVSTWLWSIAQEELDRQQQLLASVERYAVKDLMRSSSTDLLETIRAANLGPPTPRLRTTGNAQELPSVLSISESLDQGTLVERGRLGTMAVEPQDAAKPVSPMVEDNEKSRSRKLTFAVSQRAAAQLTIGKQKRWAALGIGAAALLGLTLFVVRNKPPQRPAPAIEAASLTAVAAASASPQPNSVTVNSATTETENTANRASPQQVSSPALSSAGVEKEGLQQQTRPNTTAAPIAQPRRRNDSAPADKRASREKSGATDAGAASTPPNEVGCTQPHFMDERGIKRIKPECI